MKKAARAIIIRDKKLLAMKRNKFGKQYYALIGGGIEEGETPQQALVRELHEEIGLDIKKFQLVFIEEPAHTYGTQYIYLCEDPGGEPILQTDSIEAKIDAEGKNTYQPVWLDLDTLDQQEFLSPKLKNAILEAVKNGFPKTPKTL